MERHSRSIVINAPIEQVFHFHDDTRNLLKITPPNINVRIKAMGTPGLHYQVTLTVVMFRLLPMKWVVRITEYEPPFRMTDEQVSGPFTTWKQTRLLREVEGGTELTDVVEYEAPFGVLGRIANALVIKRQIADMFSYRQQATKRLLESA
jgi:ligand-binding SRPBCC domain-containing protein